MGGLYSRRSMIWKLVFCVTAAPSTAMAAAGKAREPAQPHPLPAKPAPRHALAMHGTPRLADGFTQLP